MEDKRLAVNEDAIEPELVSPGGHGRAYGQGGRAAPPPPPTGLLARFKALLASVLALLGIGLFLLGALLTSTVIGAIIGIPLILLGALLFFLLFKLLASGSSPIIIRRF